MNIEFYLKAVKDLILWNLDKGFVLTGAACFMSKHYFFQQYTFD